MKPIEAIIHKVVHEKRCVMDMSANTKKLKPHRCCLGTDKIDIDNVCGITLSNAEEGRTDKSFGLRYMEQDEQDHKGILGLNFFQTRTPARLRRTRRVSGSLHTCASCESDEERKIERDTERSWHSAAVHKYSQSCRIVWKRNCMMRYPR